MIYTAAYENFSSPNNFIEIRHGILSENCSYPDNTVASKLFVPIDICILTLAVIIIALGESELT